MYKRQHHEREAAIVAEAGRLGMVTIATNMAGRGTDIIPVSYTHLDVYKRQLSDWFSMGIDFFIGQADRGLTALHINETLRSLIIDGVCSGVGSVLSFLPTIVLLFFMLSILEDSGYMARVAFVMDNLLRKIGLSGRSFVPMLIGFGCSVPAIMATRTLSSERDRRPVSYTHLEDFFRTAE